MDLTVQPLQHASGESVNRLVSLRVLALVAALTIPWGLASVVRATPIPPNTPPALDQFLSAVANATPRHTRLLVAGSLSALVFYRATYRLYPRAVDGYLVRPYTAVDSWVGLPPTWSTAVGYARRVHARYVALWESPFSPPATMIRLRYSGGVLVELPR